MKLLHKGGRTGELKNDRPIAIIIKICNLSGSNTMRFEMVKGREFL